MSRTGDWIQTYTGVQFWPLDPQPEEIRIEDIAHALSMQCRFGGHCRVFYSVAEHSVRVSRELPAHLKSWGLLHDAAEAYLVDLPRPLKRSCEMGVLYSQIEDRLMAVICERFGLTPNPPIEIKRIDTVLLMTEKRDLMSWFWFMAEDTEEPLTEPIDPWEAGEAESRFLTLAGVLGVL
jgi:uncharacterized protein